MCTEGDDFGTADIRIGKIGSDLVNEFSSECCESGGNARIGKGLCECA